MDPINYGALQQQLNLQPLAQGLQLRRQNQAFEAQQERQQAITQLAQQKFELDQQQDAQYLQAVQAYQANPTPEALRDLGIRFPDKAAALQKAGDSYTTSQKQDLIGAGFSALGALAANNVPLATSTLEKRRDALKNSGIDTSHTDAAIQMLKDGKTKEATAYLSYAMSGLVGADHAAGVMESLGVGKKAEDRAADNERQDRALDLREKATEASIARGEAASARAERAADRADRKAAGSGSGGGGQYEYRVVNGALQRRRK